MKCPKCVQDLKPFTSRQGTIVDFCQKCSGIWLDGGEIYSFIKHSPQIIKQFVPPLRQETVSAFSCPREHGPMKEGALPEGETRIEYCQLCQGMWFDKGELDWLQSKIAGAKEIQEQKFSGPVPPPRLLLTPAAGLLSLPSLALRSGMVLFVLYGLLFVVLAAVFESGGISAWHGLWIGVIVAFFQFLLSPFILDWTLQWWYSLEWIPLEKLPPAQQEFIRRVCAEQKMKIPRMGMIQDGTPNAFTYGHHPNNARVVITEGLIDKLTEDELNAVIGHEMGHARHWDMLISTVAALVPMILYWLYRHCIRKMRKGKRTSKGNPYPLVALISYLLYIIAEYLVLFLSRTREYHADRFGAQAVGNPNTMASALIKIAYGIASEGRDDIKKKDDAMTPESEIRALQTLGIFNQQHARALVASSIGSSFFKSGSLNVEAAQAAMQWDLWNPWAGLHELHSTHPLPAKRILHLCDQSEAMGIEPLLRFETRKPESYWDEFLVDVLMCLLPWIGSAAGLAAAYYFSGTLSFNMQTNPAAVKNWGYLLFGWGTGSFLKALFSYPLSGFLPQSVVGLLKQIKVSGVRGVPCELRGKVIGRGIPGLVFSEDMVMQDSTGYIFLDYRLPFGIMEFFFGLYKLPGIVDRNVVARGWYRRGVMPFVELHELEIEGTAKIHRAPVAALKKALALIAAMIGAGLFLFN